MKDIFFFFIFGVMSVTLQGTLLNGVPSRYAQIDLVWLLVLFLSFYGSSLGHLLLVFFFGLLVDAGTPYPGLFTLIYLITFLFIRVAFARIYAETAAALFIWTGLLTVAAQGIELFVLNQFGVSGHLPFMGLQVLFQVLLNGLLGLLIYPFLQNLTGNEKRPDYVS